MNKYISSLKFSKESIYISEEAQFIEELEQQKEILINESLNIKNGINILNKETIIINGENSGKLNFDNSYGIYMESIKNIKISNISINGILTTKNVENLYFKNVNFEGNIASYNNLNNVNFIFENCKFYSSNLKNNHIGIELTELNNVVFKDCLFVGNENIENILFFGGTEETLDNTIEIKNSYFNGYNNSLCFNGSFGNININNSNFTNCVDNISIYGGAVHIYKSYSNIKNSRFENCHSVGMGGCVGMITSNVDFESNVFHNCTALYGGNGLVSLDNSEQVITFQNSIHTGDPNSNYLSLGAIMSCFGKLDLIIKDLYGYGLHSTISGGLFFFNGEQNIIMRNITINDITGKNVGGLFLHALGGVEAAKVDIDGCYLSNFFQYSEINSCSFIWLNYGIAKINNCNLYNFKGRNNCILYQDTNSYTEIKNSIFEKYSSNTPSIIINNHSYGTKNEIDTLMIKNCKFMDMKTNIYTLLASTGGTVNIINTEVKDIEAINHYNGIECKTLNNYCSIFGLIVNDSILNISNTTYTNITGKIGFASYYLAK
ncbi:hypothetical protein BCR32DRAFT_270235 [Anaeromyces robustus]|uniref:Right handed beta helix domain-containing protein n=1 Tax=Anaeromyces robustus TaxID=1754192 RepID=A0A1Y1WYI8_9FUNG|nr:hypothetical protein BCR32DRAFT_270235 [Anaeromyces robustus]|eukprot:ORX78154.1 hypothetical protein BCR32DRAFT_270235 [Anaeromyces robustus]